jgi:hypothetical protein
MAERTKAMVLKTIVGQPTGGSNPSPSAKSLQARVRRLLVQACTRSQRPRTQPGKLGDRSAAPLLCALTGLERRFSSLHNRGQYATRPGERRAPISECLSYSSL